MADRIGGPPTLEDYGGSGRYTLGYSNSIGMKVSFEAPPGHNLGYE